MTKQRIVNSLYELYSFVTLQFKIFFTFKRKIFILAQPQHPNLGDQAQLYCTHLWLKENYPNCCVIELGCFLPTLNIPPYRKLPFKIVGTFIMLINLKLSVRKNSLFIGHSGYFFVDHHDGWNMFLAILHFFPKNRMIIFPQTINFYTPEIRRVVSNYINNFPNTLLMCRDEVSYKNAQVLFPNIKLRLYPDIVTSLIGTKLFSHDREGILFCMRDDVEAYYSVSDIEDLMSRFSGIRQQKIDTTINNISPYKMRCNRQKLIEDVIEKMASFQVVITDRYHGTIFSAIASTPVIVISSADHKLSSGVKWFPKEFFNGYIYYAESLDNAFNIANHVLESTSYTYNNPAYFKNNYFDKLNDLISELEKV